MLLLEKVLELIAFGLIAADAVGVDAPRRWEHRLRDELWATYGRPEHEVGNLLRVMDWRLAGVLAAFNRWKAEHGLADAFVGAAAALASAGLWIRLALR